MKHMAIYCRVSSKQQDTASQKPDLERWAVGQDQPGKWYSDTFTPVSCIEPLKWKQNLADKGDGGLSVVNETVAEWPNAPVCNAGVRRFDSSPSLE